MAARVTEFGPQRVASSVRVAEKRDDSLFPKPDNLLDQPGALEALADAAIRRAQAAPLRAIPGFKPRQG